MATHRVIGPDDPKYPAIRRRLFWTWMKTIAGYLSMGALVEGALLLFHCSLSVIYGWGLIWVALPVVMWWYCAQIALALTKSTPADPNNPEHRRLIDLVHNVWLISGLKHEPPVYVSDNPLPNAFCTGPIHRKAVVAATKGLFLCGMTDDEIMAVFAHELGHDLNYDVLINSFISVISSVFFLVVNYGVDAWLKTIKIFLPKARRQQMLPGIAGGVVFYFIFWLTGQMTRIIQLFVVRSRESAADATGALITGRPCDLAVALQKLVRYVESHPPKGREAAFWRAIRPMMFFDPIYDAVDHTDERGIWGAIKKWWKNLQLTHPPVPERVAMLERMNGGACPRI